MDGNNNNNNNNNRNENDTTPVSNKVSSPNKTNKRNRARPHPVFIWTNSDVCKWFKRHCAEIQVDYSHLFVEHDIIGRSLIRMNDVSLEKLGITDPKHRDEVLREILKLRLKGDILELKDLQNKLKK